MTGIRQQLLTIHQLTSEAIDSDAARGALELGWRSIQKELAGTLPNADDARLLVAVCRNSEVIAQSMYKSESMLQDLLRERLVPDGIKDFESPKTSSVSTRSSPSSSLHAPVCLMRTWFYENLIYPFPTVAIRRQIQKTNKMPMSNINGWFSNMRRRCGWNEFCRSHAGGERSATSQLMRACFKGEEKDEGLVKKIVAMIDYVIGEKTKGDVGNWLTKIVGCGKPDLRNYPDVKIDVIAKNSAKRMKSSGHRHFGLSRQKEIDDLSDDEASEIESEAIMEIDPLDRPIAPVMASSISFHPGYMPQNNTFPPHRTFSGSSTSSSVSNISAGIHSRVPSSEYSRRPADTSSVFASSPAYAHTSALPITFGGPAQHFGFQPYLPPLDQPRGMKRPMHQMDSAQVDPRAFKFARSG